MSHVKKILVGSVLGAVGLFSSAQASTVSILPVVTRSADLAGVLVANNPNVSTNPGVSRYYEISLFVKWTSGAANQNAFGGLTMDGNAFTGVLRAPTSNLGIVRPNFVATNPLWTDADSASHTTFDTDADTGDPGLGLDKDLANLVATTDYGGVPPGDPADPRPAIGSPAAGTKFGAFWVKWDGTASGSVFLDLKDTGFFDQTAGGNAIDNSPTLNDATVNFGGAPPAPEPTTLGLLSMGSLLVLRRRRA